MKRRLSPEELRDIFTKCTAREATWQEVDLLKDHVDVLEGELAAHKRRHVEPRQRWHRFARSEDDARYVDLSRIVAFDPGFGGGFDSGTMLRIEGAVDIWVQNTGAEVAAALGIKETT